MTELLLCLLEVYDLSCSFIFFFGKLSRFCAQLGGNRIQAAEHEVYFYTWTVASDRYLA